MTLLVCQVRWTREIVAERSRTALVKPQPRVIRVVATSGSRCHQLVRRDRWGDMAPSLVQTADLGRDWCSNRGWLL